MNTKGSTPKILAGFLCLGLALPAQASALRQEQAKDNSNATSRLETALQTGLEESIGVVKIESLSPERRQSLLKQGQSQLALKPWQLLRVSSMLSFAAFDQKKTLIGMIQGHQRYYRKKPATYLYDLYVDRKWRRQGIGPRLVEKVEQATLEAGITQVVLEIQKDNEAAQRFYERLGYQRSLERLNDISNRLVYDKVLSVQSQAGLEGVGVLPAGEAILHLRQDKSVLVKLYRVGTSNLYHLETQSQEQLLKMLGRSALFFGLELDGAPRLVPMDRFSESMKKAGLRTKWVQIAYSGDMDQFSNFYTAAGEALFKEERWLRDALETEGLISRANGQWTASASVALTALSQDITAWRSSVGRHEWDHALFFTEPGYQGSVQKIWEELSEQERQVVKDTLRWEIVAYHLNDDTVTLMEFSANFRNPIKIASRWREAIETASSAAVSASDLELSEERLKAAKRLWATLRPGGAPSKTMANRWIRRLKEISNELEQAAAPYQSLWEDGVPAVSEASQAGLEEQRFGSVEAFLAQYGERLQALGLKEQVQQFSGAGQVVLVPEATINQVVLAYTHSGWVNAVDRQLQSDFIVTVSYPQNGQVELPAVVIQQVGVNITAPNPALPILKFLTLEQAKGQLTPGLIYAVALSEVFQAQGLGVAIGVLTFQDAKGNTLYALFV